MKATLSLMKFTWHLLVLRVLFCYLILLFSCLAQKLLLRFKLFAQQFGNNHIRPWHVAHTHPCRIIFTLTTIEMQFDNTFKTPFDLRTQLSNVSASGWGSAAWPRFPAALQSF